jgi:hypothetical protein
MLKGEEQKACNHAVVSAENRGGHSSRFDADGIFPEAGVECAHTAGPHSKISKRDIAIVAEFDVTKRNGWTPYIAKTPRDCTKVPPIDPLAQPSSLTSPSPVAPFPVVLSSLLATIAIIPPFLSVGASR